MDLSKLQCGPAADSVAPEQAYALIIGISKYRDERIPNLKFTHADAEAFYQLLLDPQRAGMLAENVRLLRDEEADLRKMRSSISKWLFERVKPGSTVLFFFAGHGAQEPDKLGNEQDGIAKYLLPWDADPEDLYASALSSSQLQEMFRMIRADRVVFFMDACYAGGVASGGARARDLAVAANPTFRRLATGEGRLMISAAQPDQRSWEDDSVGHGIFTYHLLEALKGKADLDDDGCVSICEVFKYLEREVPNSARRLAGGIQEPMLAGELSKDIVLSVNQPRVKERSAALQAAERERRKTIKGKREKLCEWRDADRLPLEAFHEAMLLIEKHPNDLNARETEVCKYLEALFGEAIGPDLYVRTRQLLAATPEPVSNTRDGVAPASHGFCIHCGAGMAATNAFCTACGKPR